MGCPDRDCQKHVDEIFRELYGHEGSNNGMKRDVKKLVEEMPCKLSIQSVKKWLFFVAVPVILIVGGSGANMYAIQQSLPHQFAGKSAIAKHEARLIVLEENYKHIKDQLRDINKIQRTNRQILETLQDLKKKSGTKEGRGVDF